MALPTFGPNPRYLEELKIGGGYNSSPDGGTDIDATGNIATNGDVTIGGDLDVAGTDRTWSVWLDATAAIFVSGANPAAVAATTSSSFYSNYNYLAFDQLTHEFIAFQAAFPEDYDGSAIDVTLYWGASGGTGDVIWRARLGSFGNNETHIVATTDIGSVGDTFLGANLIHKVTKSATPMNGTPGGLLLIGVDRQADSGSDTLTADARLIGVRLSYT